jgi:hypothetical protein
MEKPVTYRDMDNCTMPKQSSQADDSRSRLSVMEIISEIEKSQGKEDGQHTGIVWGETCLCPLWLSGCPNRHTTG